MEVCSGWNRTVPVSVRGFSWCKASRLTVDRAASVVVTDIIAVCPGQGSWEVSLLMTVVMPNRKRLLPSSNEMKVWAAFLEWRFRAVGGYEANISWTYLVVVVVLCTLCLLSNPCSLPLSACGTTVQWHLFHANAHVRAIAFSSLHY